ncbi:DUF2290 domain-containing protein [Stenotrophomonas sp. C2852]|uniref:DUF2290 domain-containing protein n=1 Tax=Stenotrophomonas sp. C2852 TaxID=3077845 RepID=UPI00293CB324|nr:DUF2290 domain-containing protein [Stenotrophomonas sp. C2852]MDV3436122.1 DUF2290 domain-containing protein [Stenotrophomonas sp. C2852]
MDRRAVVEGIYASWRFFEGSLMAESFASPDPLSVDLEFREMIMSDCATHESLYSYCLRKSYFNILLYDHSFFQFGWSSYDNVRFAYYPNPYVSSNQALGKFRKYKGMLEGGLLQDEDFGQLVSALTYRGSVPIFRYENAPDQYVPLTHPCSHMHIGVHGENRWALRRQLTPLAFSMLIAKHYYPVEWGLGVKVGAMNGENSYEADLVNERKKCRIVSQFSPEEELAFHWF